MLKYDLDFPGTTVPFNPAVAETAEPTTNTTTLDEERAGTPAEVDGGPRAFYCC